MRKTGGEIEYDVYTFLESEITAKINGTVYLQGTRPLNAKTEDAVISFMTGLDNQVQTGAVTINVYIPDLDMGQSDLVKNIARCNEIEVFMLRLIEKWKVKTEYRFTLGNTIKTFPEDDINQHFVNVKLKYKRFSN